MPDDLGRAAGTSDAPQFVSFGSVKPPGLIHSPPLAQCIIYCTETVLYILALQLAHILDWYIVV